MCNSHNQGTSHRSSAPVDSPSSLRSPVGLGNLRLLVPQEYYQLSLVIRSPKPGIRIFRMRSCRCASGRLGLHLYDICLSYSMYSVIVSCSTIGELHPITARSQSRQSNFWCLGVPTSIGLSAAEYAVRLIRFMRVNSKRHKSESTGSDVPVQLHWSHIGHYLALLPSVTC